MEYTATDLVVLIIIVIVVISLIILKYMGDKSVNTIKKSIENENQSSLKSVNSEKNNDYKKIK